MCIQGLKLCCGKGRYGKTCEACPGGADSPCNGHGVCDGEGTRGGKGKCKCDLGYKGKSCTSCKKGFYKAQPAPDGGAPECKQCDVACAACIGASPAECSEVRVSCLRLGEVCRPRSHGLFFFCIFFSLATPLFANLTPSPPFAVPDGLPARRVNVRGH